MDVRVEGSLLVTADCVLGHLEAPHYHSLPDLAHAGRPLGAPTPIHVTHPDGSSQVQGPCHSSPHLLEAWCLEPAAAFLIHQCMSRHALEVTE